MAALRRDRKRTCRGGYSYLILLTACSAASGGRPNSLPPLALTFVGEV